MSLTLRRDERTPKVIPAKEKEKKRKRKKEKKKKKKGKKKRKKEKKKKQAYVLYSVLSIELYRRYAAVDSTVVFS